jgi:hypothetical protein
VSPTDLRKGYNKWRKSTATSPSGIHLGHYKTLSRQRPTKPKEGEEWKPNLGENFLEIEAITSSIALQHSYVYKRWETVVSLMLENKPGIPRIDKLRVIHLFKADLNILFGIIWNRRRC